MLHLMPEKSSVEGMIKRACQIVELKALKKYILIKCKKTDLFTVFDMKWTVEGIGNILDNAVKYSPEQSCIDVSITAYESFLCIQVSDYGIGIKEEEQGLIFQRFYRSKDVKDQIELGIGLYLSREIFFREGGYIKTESLKREGTKFKVFLPLN
ncbi:MAG: sensor histidine kinase [Lachnospiraceae bacterium]|nr:sensor histidine kinase [Lachnospiraceae bacterium]